MKEIVKYESRLNTLPLSEFNAVELDLFMALCSKTKEKGQELLTFTYNDLKKITGLSHQSDKYFHNELYKMSDKMVRIHCHFVNEKEFVSFNLFSTFRGNLENKELTVRVNQDFAFLLNELTRGFTRFELGEFIKLESKYSKNLYRLLKQYRKTGTYSIESDKFRKLMDCPESYPNSEFMRVCVNVAVKELSRGYFEELRVEPIRAKKKGAPIVAYKFSFKPSLQVPGQYSLDDYEPEPKQKANPKPEKKQPDYRLRNKFNNFKQRQYSQEDYEAIERAGMTPKESEEKENE